MQNHQKFKLFIGRIYKKVACLNSGEKVSNAEKARIILGLRQDYKLAILLQVAGFSRSTFYYQCQVLELDDKYKELKVHICAIYDKHKGRYGYRRITAVLRENLYSRSTTRPYSALCKS